MFLSNIFELIRIKGENVFGEGPATYRRGLAPLINGHFQNC